MKVVRAHINQVLPLLYTTSWPDFARREEETPSHPPSFRLIYLIRDPRAILTSILEREMDFSSQKKDPEILCDTLMQDLQALKALSRQLHRFVTVIRQDVFTSSSYIFLDPSTFFSLSLLFQMLFHFSSSYFVIIFFVTIVPLSPHCFSNS